MRPTGVIGALFVSACASVPAPPSPVPAPFSVDALRPGDSLRVSVGTTRLTGRLIRLTTDSLLLSRPDTIGLSRSSIDTLWRRTSHGATAFGGGLLFGVLLAGAILLSGRSSADPGLNGKLAFAVVGVAALFGALIGSLSPGWEHIFQR